MAVNSAYINFGVSPTNPIQATNHAEPLSEPTPEPLATEEPKE